MFSLAHIELLHLGVDKRGTVVAIIDQPGDSAALEAILALARRDGPAWFADLDPARTGVEVTQRFRRDRCDLYRLDIGDGRVTASVIAKVRQSAHGGPVGTGRPTLMPAEPLDGLAMARLEFAGLGMVAEAGAGSPWIRIRPLAMIPEHAAVVMDRVPLPTLRHALLGVMRLRGPAAVRADWADNACRAAGAWLRHYHGQQPDGCVLEIRKARRDDVVSLFARYTSYLGSRSGGTRALDRLCASAIGLAERHLPDDMPQVTGHGDFAPRNILVDRAGRVAVIDPLPRWQVPVYEDLCRFLVNLRGLGPQVVSQGCAFSASQLQRYEDAFLRGYFGEDAVPIDALRVYLLLILLDKWSATVARAGDPLRRRWFARYFRREAARQLRVAGGLAWAGR